VIKLRPAQSEKYFLEISQNENVSIIGVRFGGSGAVATQLFCFQAKIIFNMKKIFVSKL